MLVKDASITEPLLTLGTVADDACAEGVFTVNVTAVLV